MCTVYWKEYGLWTISLDKYESYFKLWHLTPWWSWLSTSLFLSLSLLTDKVGEGPNSRDICMATGEIPFPSRHTHFRFFSVLSSSLDDSLSLTHCYAMLHGFNHWETTLRQRYYLSCQILSENNILLSVYKINIKCAVTNTGRHNVVDRTSVHLLFL